MNKSRMLFAALFSVAALVFQLPAWADPNSEKARALVQEAADLTQQAADMAKEANPDNVLKVNDLLKQAEGKMADARRIGSRSAELTGEQKAGLVGSGNLDDDGVDDPSHPDNLREQTQNPVASLISVPLESNFNFGVGPADNTQYVMNAKPVIPQSVSENWNLIHRGIQPVIVQDNLTDTGTGAETDSSIFGLGDLTYQGFMSPAKPGKVIWGLGGVLVVPWGEDGLTTDKWQTGPAAVALTKKGNWVFGSVVSQQWDFAGRGNAEDVSLAVWQYFINYNLSDGWFLLSTPTMSANWEADSTGDRLTVPYGGGVGRLFKIGKKPFRASVQAYGYATTPDNVDTDWSIQAEFRLLFPK